MIELAGFDVPSGRMPGSHVFRVSVELRDFFRALLNQPGKVTFLVHFHEIGYAERGEMNAKGSLSRVAPFPMPGLDVKVKSYVADRQFDDLWRILWRLMT